MNHTNIDKKTILDNITYLDKWLIKKKFKYYTLNYTPSFNIINFLSSKVKYIGIFWRQLFRISPINFRKALGLNSEIIDPQSTIILASAYLELLKFQHNNKSFQDSFKVCINRVEKLKSNKSKFFAIKQGKKMQLKYYKTYQDDIAPILTVWAGNLYMNAFKYLKDERYLQAAEQIKNYFVNEHPKENIDDDIYFYYSPSGNFKIWNASAEISAFLIQYGKLYDDNTAYNLGIKGIDLIIKKQNDDGSWFYGNSRTTKYIDNFHTAFILRSLLTSSKYYNNEQLDKSLSQGLIFYKKELFKLNHKSQTLIPKHWVKSFIPLNSNIIQKTDIRDCALAIILFAEIQTLDKSHLTYAKQIFKWANKNMKKNKTYFAEKTWFWTNKIPYIDFQAWMLFANAILLNNLKDE